ncbi:hypothetical protein OIU85_025966 [Salix viminalis]|uniref:Uncharacterized protein n=1 Tax=Salix viminalis TaxID=40686 RepID=A0A9Q0TMM6_SALVM|nr:hypothetical protein OIU85_025966 [Salix viminalis]
MAATTVISALSFAPDGEEKARDSTYADSLKLLIHNLDLSYQLQWVGKRKVLLSRHGLELGTFPLIEVTCTTFLRRQKTEQVIIYGGRLRLWTAPGDSAI